MRDDIRRRLAAEVRETVPGAPGVYAFLDAEGLLLYVGKSVNLRRRVGGYFGRAPHNAEPHLGRLVASIRSLVWWQTPSELLALLLEDAVIKENLPPFNRRLKEMEESRYLELTAGRFPACRIVEHVPDFGAREVFGPMKDRYFAGRLQGIVHETLGIRTCGDPEPVSRCLDHDIGRCSGPCRGTMEPGRYADLVAEARDFLNGDADEVADRLTRARDAAAAAKRYEVAARLRDALDTCRRYAAHQEFARRFTEGDCIVRCARDGIEYRFSRGALVEPRDLIVEDGRAGRAVGPGFRPQTAVRAAVAALRQAMSSDLRLISDRTRIVCNWVRSRGADCQVEFDGVRTSSPGARSN